MLEIKTGFLYLLFLHKCIAFDLPHGTVLIDKPSDTTCTSDLKVNNAHYNLSDTYHIGDVEPTDAHYDIYGNLFYVESGQNEKGYYFNANIIKFKTIDPQQIPGLPKGMSYSIAVDMKATKVYFGTGRGLYSYSYETHSAIPISESTLKLDMIFVDKDSNKYVSENINGVEELYLYDGEKKIRFNSLEALNELAIDDKNNFYYIKEEKLFVLKSTLSSPICIGDVSYDGSAQISFHNDTVFIASDSLAYFHENETGKLKIVENTPGNLTAIAFESTGDFIIGIHGKILRYKKTECDVSNNFTT